MQSGWPNRILGKIALLSLIATGMILNLTPAQADVTVEKVTYKGWGESYKLSNGTVELVVVPSVCRILHYGYKGGPNVLWENKPLAGTVGSGKQETTWRNVGGDKVWPWPQDSWGTLLPSAWPPPAAADSLPFQAEVIGTDTLRITSSRVFPWGVRIIRDIKLASSGTTISITSKMVRESDGDVAPVSPWTVTQVPAAEWVMARLLPSASGLTNSYKMMGDPFKAVSKTPEGMLLVERSGAKPTKIGTDADIAATLEGDTLFTVQFAAKVPADNAGLTYVPGDRLQFYSQPDDETAAKMGTFPYIEMELTAPLKTLKKGETVSLSLVWSLHKLAKEKRNPTGVAETLKTL